MDAHTFSTVEFAKYKVVRLGCFNYHFFKQKKNWIKKGIIGCTSFYPRETNARQTSCLKLKYSSSS